jgi:hypothetical protein
LHWFERGSPEEAYSVLIQMNQSADSIFVAILALCDGAEWYDVMFPPLEK